MSIAIMSAAWAAPLVSTHKLILLSLADQADDSGYCWPSFQHTANRTGLTRRTVIRAIAELEQRGVLQRIPRSSGGRHNTNDYRIIVDALREMVTQDHHSSDTESPLVVTDDHYMVTDDHYHSDTRSLPLVTDDHQGSDRVSPESPMNHQLNHQGNREGNPPRAPATPPVEFVPVPEETRRQKARRVPEPALTANAPPVVRLLVSLTSYWPGTDVIPALVERFGDAPDEVALTRAVELWRLSGHKITNWLGLADWYDELRARPDWTPQDRFKRRSNGGAPTDTTIPAPKPIAPGLY